MKPMLRGEPYSACKLYYDGAANLAIGDYLVTPGGSAYLVQTIRQNRNRPYRKHLDCLRWPKAEIPDGAKVHPLHWYKRQKRPARTLRTYKADSHAHR
jgi:hypothetical protein